MTQKAVAIVTGASRGIGAEVAKRLGKDGVAVAVNYAANQVEAQKVVDAIKAAGGRAACVRSDISNPDEVRSLFDFAEQTFGPVTIVVNTAGVNTREPLSLIETDDDTFDHIFSVNARGTFYILRESGRRMPNGGRIVNFSSSVRHSIVPGFAVYSGSKAAIAAMSRMFAHELRGREITVNCISPGPIATDFFMEGKSDEMVRHYVSQGPIPRLGTPEEVAGAVAFLVGPDGKWVNGQEILVNGGWI
jgi:3-oxoacyl-[acyl-carrier protein] reductase